jgi:hypothetical protein
MRSGEHPSDYEQRIGRIAYRLRAATASIGATIAARIGAAAQARIHRTAIEIELHQRRFKHATKNDDDIPHLL